MSLPQRTVLHLTLWMLLASAVLVLATCTPTPKGEAGLYRTVAPETCEDVVFLSTSEFEPSLIAVPNGTGAKVVRDEDLRRCPIQQHAVMRNVPATETELSTTPETRFDIAFYEILEGDGQELRDLEAERLDAITTALQKNSRNYVIVYVHGWRHNATINNDNVRKFRTLLNYARSFMNDRPAYRDVALTGVFVGWRGQFAFEPNNQHPDDTAEDCGALCTARIAPTFLGRHSQSSQTADGVRDLVRALQHGLDIRPGNANADKLLVVGHSLGGNIIAEAIKQPMLDLIDAHSAGDTMPPPFGDLAVVVNAASEASNWNDLQRRLRSTVYPQDQSVDVYLRSDQTAIETVFPTEQRPTYLSITSACSWINADNVKETQCDTVTSRIFPLAQILRLRLSEERRVTIGHHEPDYVPDGEGGWNSVGRHALGNSHDMIINTSAEQFSTTFRNGLSETRSQCDPADGWLFAARERYMGAGRTSGRSWDSDYPPGGDVREPLVYTSKDADTVLQTRHTLGLAGATRLAPSPMPANVPFWNVRASPNVIEEHSGFVNYQAWCAINQLVLDDVTARVRKR